MIEAVELDFETKEIREVDASGLKDRVGSGGFIWIDVENDTYDGLCSRLSDLDLLNEQVLEDISSGEEATQLARYDEYLHISVCGFRFDDDDLQVERFDVIVAEHFMLTAHVGPRKVVDAIKREYAADFERHAKTPSFLLFELWDHLADHYVTVQKRIESHAERLQHELLRDADDSVFEEVAEVGSDLLRFRSVLVPARAMLTELCTRRSIFVSEATQSFLNNIVGTIERVLQDVLADRDSLSQAVNLYMSMVSHRTNLAMSKLTVISVIFLPLTFLCGVYGMNFSVLPELRWEFGYPMFWGVVIAIVAVLLVVMRRTKLL